jgi:hypothetical protein
VRFATVGVAFLAASAVAGAARPPVSLIASPAHVRLAGAGRTSLSVTNTGSSTAVVDVARARFALDLRGRPRVAGQRASWLRVAPRRLVLSPGATGTLSVSAHVPAAADPGDHPELVLLTSRPKTTRGLPVRVRLGVVVVVRVPGKVVRRLVALRLHVRRLRRARSFALLVANRGSVTETVGGACTLLWLHRRGRILARLRVPTRRILPHASGLLEFRYAGPARGRLSVRVAPPARRGCVRIHAKEVAVTL